MELVGFPPPAIRYLALRRDAASGQHSPQLLSPGRSCGFADRLRLRFGAAGQAGCSNTVGCNFSGLSPLSGRSLPSARAARGDLAQRDRE